MNALLKQFLLAATAAACIALTACGGGGSGDNPIPPSPEAHINSSNFLEATGIAAAGAQHGGDQLSAGAAPVFELKEQGTPGTYACKDGGTVNMALVDKVNNLTVLNCKSGNVFVASGAITDTSETTAAGQVHAIKIKDLSFRVGDTDLTMQTLNGSMNATLKPDGSLSAVKADFSYTRNGRTDTLALNQEANGQMFIEVQTPNFPQKLAIDISADEKTVKISSRGDGSSVTVIESSDGKSYTLELRGIGGGSPIATKTLTSAEFEALIKKWL
ncbi:hypothetical protein [Paucibacter sp. Y2R2-4]|uniref:hypothetical protein n=1 Tax=Paucibacter sp. Y2R2-4 TaxID=2893553 RepID=UPI0021E3F86C|nr:hypothetical protein [Paucibacter sp. Y2R2-4]MCV2348922.1 hypothetical protein [Paucibacter sp. Y2R2-4]